MSEWTGKQEEEMVSDIESHQKTVADKTAELEDSFSYDGYQVVRKELFAHQRDPAVTIRKDSVTFNTACISGFEDVVYINVMIHVEKKKMVVRRCSENDKDALRWCIAKPDQRKSRKVTSKPFSALIYNLMGWDTQNRYKMLGYKINFDGEELYIFDLKEPEIVLERKGRKASGEEKQIDSAKSIGEQPYNPEDWQNSFGLPVDEHKDALNITMIDGYVSIEAVNGSKLGSSGLVERTGEDSN